MPWLGTKTNMSVVTGDLQLDAGAEEGSYLIKDGVNSYVDTGAVGRYRINLQFDAKESGGVIGDDSNELEIKLEIDLATTAGPSWLGWRPYLPGEYYCQWYRIRATVRVDDAFGNRPKFLRFEHNHVRIGSIPMAASIDDLKTAPTGTEPQGTRYIVIATATGDFTGKAMQIAELVETTDRTWEFAIPVDRQEVYNLNGGWKYRYEGTFPAGGWVPRGLNVTNPEEDKFVGAVTVVGVKNHLWDTDGGGDIGAVGANRPDYIHAKTGMTIAGVAVVAGGAPSPHLLGGAHHSPDTLPNLNSKVIGGNLDLSTAQRTAIIHLLGSNLRHGADSLANLNALITGGDLDFDTAARPPTPHTLASHSSKAHAELTGVTSDQHHAQVHKDDHKSGGGANAFASTDLLEAIVKRLQVTGPVTLLIGAVADGEILKRSGTGLIGTDSPSLKKITVNQTAADSSVDIKDGGAQALEIHDGGIVDFPKQSGCSGYRNAAWNLPDAVWTKIPFDAELFDVQSEFNTGTGRFTATKAGYYLVTAAIRFSSPVNSQIGIRIERSGTVMANIFDIGNGWVDSLQVTSIIYLAATNYIEIFAYQDTVGPLAITPGFPDTRVNIMKLA